MKRKEERNKKSSKTYFIILSKIVMEAYKLEMRVVWIMKANYLSV